MEKISNQTDNRKVLIIAGISIAAVIVLVLLIFFTSQFIGKAYTALEYTAGIGTIPDVEVGTPFNVAIEANIGTRETVAIAFNLTYPKDLLTCNKVSGLAAWEEGGGLLNTAKCLPSEGKVVFEYATIDDLEALTGKGTISNITFTGLKEGIAGFQFEDFTIIDYEGHKKLPLVVEFGKVTIKNATVATCSPSTIANGVVGAYPTCTITCNTGYELKNGACVVKTTTTTTTQPITLNIIYDSLSVNYFSKGTKYSFISTVTAQEDLSSHIFFVKVMDDKGKDVAVHYQSQPALLKGNSETIRFDYQLPSAASGNYTVKSFAWTNWLSLGGKSLGSKYFVTNNYEIK